MLVPSTIIYIRKFPLCSSHVCYIFATRNVCTKTKQKHKTDNVLMYECVFSLFHNSTYKVFILFPFCCTPLCSSLYIAVGCDHQQIKYSECESNLNNYLMENYGQHKCDLISDKDTSLKSQVLIILFRKIEISSPIYPYLYSTLLNLILSLFFSCNNSQMKK